MTKNTAHSECSHPSTKSARSACRREARKIQNTSPTADDMIAQMIGTGRAVSENIERSNKIHGHVNTAARRDRCSQCQKDLADSLLEALNSNVKPRVIVVPHPSDSK